jgi:hypothetical protein
MSLYNVIKITPQGQQSTTIKCKSLKYCREYLSIVRKEYAAGLPAGQKRLCRFYGNDTIFVRDATNDGRISGDIIQYSIFSA